MKAAVLKYLEYFPDETGRLAELQRFLQKTTDPAQFYHRKNFDGHITASGFVLAPDHTRLALVKHIYLNRLLQPGGHVEAADENILSAALREIREETDIQSCRHIPFHNDPLLPIDIDSHFIPANPKKGEPGHFHHDFRFLFDVAEPVIPADDRWGWFPLETAIDDDTFKLVVKKINAVI